MTKSTKILKRAEALPTAIAAEIAKPAIAEATPITRRRIILASLCGVALLAAAASFAPRGPASQAVQAALPRPAPAVATIQRTPSDAWATIRPQDATGTITNEPRTVKKPTRRARTRPAPEKKEESAIARWYQQWYGDDKKSERRASTAR